VRWSLSTRVFLAFALVVAATGAASMYALASVAALRHELTFLRDRALPLLDAMRGSSEALRAFDEALQRAAPDDLDWVVRMLPNARPYDRVAEVVQLNRQADWLGRPPQLVRWLLPPRPGLPAIDPDLAGLARARASRDRMAADDDLVRAAGGFDGASSDEQAYDVLTRALQRAIADRRLADAARLVVELRRMIRHVDGAVGRSQAAVERGLAARAELAQHAEARLVAVVALSAALSLLISVLMLLASAFAIRPLAALTQVVRRFAAGDRRARAAPGGAHEIATLAEEWNRMAGALVDREAQLMAQREELGRAERLTALGHMAARMAHEVRNPLSSIGLNAELLGEELAKGGEIDRVEARELVGAIGAEVERLRVLTDGYLSRACPVEGSHAALDLAALARETVEFVHPELERRAITAHVDLPPAMPVIGDDGALRQVLWNLLRNAWEAQPDGGSVWIDGKVAAGRASLAVEDAGVGVPTELRAQIFEPFFTSKPRGTGIGLAVARDIARHHGGAVALEAGSHGGGARFVVTLPVAGGNGAVAPD